MNYWRLNGEGEPPFRRLLKTQLGHRSVDRSRTMMESVPGAVATGSQTRHGRDRQTLTRSLPLPVLTPSQPLINLRLTSRPVAILMLNVKRPFLWPDSFRNIG